ncbi:MAG: hypothetical protein U9R00_00960 [Patescibacteria group bacterium]|nr:hypothetical protein [Patescibacteria group bacterium]
MDITIYECELSYDSLHVGPKGYKNIFSHLCWYCRDVVYADECHNSSNLFGCCGLKKKEYCIFNKQYSKEEYLELKKKIIEHMKKTGECGEYPPVSFSPHGYNHTLAQEFYPMEKEEVISKSWNWLPDIDIKTKYNLTSPTRDIPNNLKDVDEKMCDDILECKETGSYFKIHLDEYNFYKKYNLPIPDLCPKERNHRRWDLTKPRKLYHHTCMKEGCDNKFETSYSPEEKETVYCESCYKKEVY